MLNTWCVAQHLSMYSLSRFIAASFGLFSRFSLYSNILLVCCNCILSIFYYYCVAFLKDRANEIYKKVEDLKSIRGRNQDAILAACLYIACRQEDRPRTVKGT